MQTFGVVMFMSVPFMLFATVALGIYAGCKMTDNKEEL